MLVNVMQGGLSKISVFFKSIFHENHTRFGKNVKMPLLRFNNTFVIRLNFQNNTKKIFRFSKSASSYPTMYRKIPDQSKNF